MNIFQTLMSLRGEKEDGMPKPSVLKDILDNPEDYKLEAYIEGEGITMRIRRRQKKLVAAQKTADIMKGVES